MPIPRINTKISDYRRRREIYEAEESLLIDFPDVPFDFQVSGRKLSS